jgi:flagellar basal body rod protein FlgG
MKIGTALTTAMTGVQAGTRILEVSSQNTANAMTDGFVPLEASLQSLASGGVRVRVTRGSGGPEGLEAAAPTSSGVDLVEEVVDQVRGVAIYRANLQSLKNADDAEGVLVRMAGRRGDDGEGAAAEDGADRR